MGIMQDPDLLTSHVNYRPNKFILSKANYILFASSSVKCVGKRIGESHPPNLIEQERNREVIDRVTLYQ